MGWFKKKEPQVPVLAPQKEKVFPEATVTVFSFPKSEYKVYWEKHVFEHPEGPWVAEVRFIGYNGFNHRATHTVSGTSKEEVEKLSDKLIVEKMEDYKWH